MKSFTPLMLVGLGLVALGCSRPVTPAQRARLPIVSETPPQVGSQPRPGAIRADGTTSDGPSAVMTLAMGAPRVGDTTDANLQYDPSTELTIHGPILGKREVRIAGDEEHTAVVIRMHRGPEILPVYIAPTAWLAGKGIKVSVASTATVTGSLGVVNGRPTVMARTIDLGLGEVELRDADGLPNWHVPTY